jgi:hypothetical protein
MLELHLETAPGMSRDLAYVEETVNAPKSLFQNGTLLPFNV